MQKERFIEEVSKKILAEKCDLFVGSGISSESHMTSWEELLRPLAEGMGISLTKEDDLPMIAQYIVNDNSGNKNIIYNRIIECYGKDYVANKYHKAIAKQNPDFRERRPNKYSKAQISHALDLLQKYSYKQVEEMTGISKSTLLRKKSSK